MKLTVALLVLMLACHGRSATNPEDLILNATEETPVMVEATLGGMVSCATCQSGAAMLIEVREAGSAAIDPLVSQPMDQVGAYEAVVRVAPKTQLTVQAHVFAGGGILTNSATVAVPEGEAKVALTVNLHVP